MWYRWTGGIAIGYSAAVLIVVFCIPVAEWINSEAVAVAAFAIACLFFLLFLTTFLKDGLDTSGEEELSREWQQVYLKLRRDSAACRVLWCGFIAFSILIWLKVGFGPSLNAFYIPAIFMSFMSGYWLRYVYPIARG